MVKTNITHRFPVSHIRPLDTGRDLVAVADLLEEAFRGELEPAGVRAVREMRLLGQWGGLLATLDSLIFPDAAMGPGYVWVEDNQVVGHLSLRRATHRAAAWLIGNVAVRADHRRRGIARALMEHAIEHIRRQGGHQASLLVRASNLAAVRLYTAMGFRQTGALAYWRRPPTPRRTAGPLCALPADVSARQARADDQRKIYDMARAARPEDMAWVEPVRYSDFYAGWDRRLMNWLEGKRQICLVAEASQGMVGAAWAEAPRPPDEGQVRIWTQPAYHGRLEAGLMGAVLDRLAAPVTALVCTFPAHDTLTSVALAQFGFLPVKILAHMQLKL